MQRPRDRRRCQRQHIHILPDLLDLLLVTHAETLFLVDDQKPQILMVRKHSLDLFDRILKAFQFLHRVLGFLRLIPESRFFNISFQLFDSFLL